MKRLKEVLKRMRAAARRLRRSRRAEPVRLAADGGALPREADDGKAEGPARPDVEGDGEGGGATGLVLRCGLRHTAPHDAHRRRRRRHQDRGDRPRCRRARTGAKAGALAVERLSGDGGRGARRWSNRSNESWREQAVVGVGTPGAVSAATGLIKNANSTALNGQPFARDLAEALAREVRLENDANCFALSEAQDGAGAGYAMVFGVILGTGVGGGIVHDRRLWVGAQSIAGEWGHNEMPSRTEPGLPDTRCYCGRRRCIETYLSGPALAADHCARRCRSAARRARRSPRWPARAMRVPRATLARFCNRLAARPRVGRQRARSRCRRARRRPVEHRRDLRRGRRAPAANTCSRIAARRRSCATGMAILRACAARRGSGRSTRAKRVQDHRPRRD